MHWHSAMASGLSVTAVQAKRLNGVLQMDVWQHVHTVRLHPKKGLAKTLDCNYCGAGDNFHGKDMSGGLNDILEHFGFIGVPYVFHSYVV